MTTARDSVIHVAGLVKTYGDQRAVADISFDVAQGETVALLGPNGAGKTTTVEILEGYRTRTTGTVQVLGEDPADAGLAWRGRIGIVLQTSSAFETATVRELVGHFAALYRHPRDVTQTIAAVGLEAHSDKRLRALSGGQRRRVDVALGVIGRPEVLFLDEPTTGFDPEARREFWTLIRELQDEGTSILLTTHYLDEAAALAQRAVVIAQGIVVADAPINTLGGRDARRPQVRWRDSRGLHEVVTDQPAELISQVYAKDPRITDLEVERPTLEDIYLRLVEQVSMPNTPAAIAKETSR